MPFPVHPDENEVDHYPKIEAWMDHVEASVEAEHDGDGVHDPAHVVKMTGDQTVAGLKTFSSIPALPASDPTTANQAARKAYVDRGFGSFARWEVGWYWFPQDRALLTNGTGAGNTPNGTAPRFSLIVFPESDDVDELLGHVTRADTTPGTCKFGLFSVSGDLDTPTFTLLGSTAALSTATTGWKAGAITPVAVTAGALYAVGVGASGSLTVITWEPIAGGFGRSATGNPYGSYSGVAGDFPSGSFSASISPSIAGNYAHLIGAKRAA